MRRGGALDRPCDVRASPPPCAALWPCAFILGSPDGVRGRGVRLGASSPVERTVTPSPGASPHGLRALATVTRERSAHHLCSPLWSHGSDVGEVPRRFGVASALRYSIPLHPLRASVREATPVRHGRTVRTIGARTTRSLA